MKARTYAPRKLRKVSCVSAIYTKRTLAQSWKYFITRIQLRRSKD